MKCNSLCLLAALAFLQGCAQQEIKFGISSNEKVVAAMTTEEKVNMVVGTRNDPNAKVLEGGTVIGQSRNIVPGCAGVLYSIPRLDIPPVVLADGPAGLRISPTRKDDENTYYCTHFPIGTLLASTWNTQLVEEVGRAIGEEVHEYGVDILLAPALNIHRNPLCGRNFEYYSEDPVVSGKIAAAYVNGVQSQGVGTSIKHFAVNNQETNRKRNDAILSERALREIYLKGFEIAVKESQPWTVMSSYNHVNGVYTSESEDLLRTILRDEWGYKGYVMTDWLGGYTVVKQMVAGNNLLMPGYDAQVEGLTKALEDGTLDEAILDRNIKEILDITAKTPRANGYQFSNKPDLKGHAQVTRQSATEGMILLKNQDGALPLGSEVHNVALFGSTSYNFIAGGTGSGDVNRAYTVSLTEGLNNNGYEYDSRLASAYAAEKEKGTAAGEPSDDAKLLAKSVNDNDIAIITIGRNSGEGSDRRTGEGGFLLKTMEQNLISNVCDAFHAAGKKVVVIMNIAGIVEIDSWRGKPDAILCAWQGGQEGGNSVADILAGKVSPSGKLTMSWPIRLTDVPSHENFPLDMKRGNSFGRCSAENASYETRNFDYTLYEEGIYVGYRYYDKFGKDVAYPFGYGLSYTTFDYSDIAVSSKKGEITVKVTVTNSGSAAGKEAVQIYASAPERKDKPEKELKAFAKTEILQPGESQVLTMKFKVSDLASYDEASHAWKVDAGEYQILVAASSRDIKGSAPLKVKAVTIPAHAVCPTDMI